jgi:hypothetical protein
LLGVDNGVTPHARPRPRVRPRRRAPFSSTAERTLSAGQPDWVTPGPGSYIEQSSQRQRSGASSNNFVNKVCHTAVG